MPATVDVTLPHGNWRGGARDCGARIRALTGADEAFLLENEELQPAERTTALIARCLLRLGDSECTPDAVRDLTVGDREALLLQIRRLSFGDELDCVVACPECGEKMDVELSVGDLLLPPYPHAAERYDRAVGENGTAYAVRFRLPTGADQEASAAVARTDVGAAAELVLRRCVEELAGDADRHLPGAVNRLVPAAMAELDPQAEIRLSLACVACGQPVSILLDAGDFLSREVLARAEHLEREVHLLAYHYHWGEHEILGLTAERRRRYLELIAEERSRSGAP